MIRADLLLRQVSGNLALRRIATTAAVSTKGNFRNFFKNIFRNIKMRNFITRLKSRSTGNL